MTPQGAVGSNPTFSAVSTGILIEYRLLVSLFGEVPKRLKGLPWKGSRSLIAARGFKSLLLRLNLKRFKKLLTMARDYDIVIKLLTDNTNIDN